jgi:hypothetical protein
MLNIIYDSLGYPGRLVSGSKSGYYKAFPKNMVVFNSNLILTTSENPEPRKIWYGDLDLTNDSEKLQELAEKLNGTLHVLYEMDGRFENENSPKIDRAVARITATSLEVGERVKDFYEIKDGTFFVKRN